MNISSLFFLLIPALSTYLNFVEVKESVEVSFTSSPSSITKVELILYSNNKFTLLIQPFDQTKATSSKGIWFMKDNSYYLRFTKQRGLTLKALFPDISLNDGNVEIIDNESFMFNSSVMELIIYGENCKRGNNRLGSK